MGEFDNKVVLISGGLGDIGQAIAQAFLDKGAIVALSDRFSPEVASEKLPMLKDQTVALHYAEVDVSQAEQVSGWIAAIRERLGPIAIGIANAAKVTLKNYRELSDAEWRSEMNVNLDGAFYMANGCAKLFVADSMAGNILFLGSWAAHAVHVNLPAYSVSKAAIRMLCQSMALEYAASGIRVNEIAPGYVNAGLSKVVWAQNPDLQNEAASVVPLGKILEVDEIAQQVLWMCSEQCKHLTGASIVLDGGLSLIRP